jgi:NAD(P)-dependent dehydrogenase (short-subunit alcohol dehydrogenase family)
MPVALVTGASQGIGRATALALATAGFSVGLVARSRATLNETRDLALRRGAKAVGVVADVTHEDDIRAAIAETERHFGAGVDVLVNNAGSMLAIGPLWEVDPADWWTDVHTNLGGAFACCRAVVPGMIERGAGRIVNLSSYAAARPAPYQTAYAAAKAGLTSLTEALAASLEPHGVRAFAVAPGFTATEMTRALAESTAGRRWLPEAGSRDPIDPELTTRLITRLALGEGDALNGRLLHSLDDLDELSARIAEIRRDDLYALRLRRLPRPQPGDA